MEIKVLSSETSIVDGKVVIKEETQRTMTSTEINNFIITEQQKQITIKGQMQSLKSEFEKSVMTVEKYKALYEQLIPTEDLPKIE